MLTYPFRRTGVVLLLAILTPLAALRGQVRPLADSALVAQVDSIVQEQRRIQELIGLAVVIVKNGEIIYSQGYGYSNWERLQPVTTSTKFRWASMSKSLTALLGMKLQEEKVLSLDSLVSSFDPELRFPGVRLGHLLQNRSGLGHYNEMNQLFPAWNANLKKYPGTAAFNAKAATDIFKEAPLAFTPGERYLYSTFGFVVAGRVIDTVGRRQLGKGYLELVDQYIRQPFGLSSLQPDYRFDSANNKTQGYYRGPDNSIVRRNDDEVSWKLAGGGFESDIVDLGRYMSGLMRQVGLQPSSYAQLWSRQPDADYGYGFAVDGEGRNLRVGHSGTQAKTRTVFWVYPNRQLGVGVMLNSEWGEPTIVADHLLRHLGVPLTPAAYTPTCVGGRGRGTTYHGVWRAGLPPQELRRGYTTPQLQAEINFLATQGYQVTDVESFLDASQVRRWDAIFQKQENPSRWVYQLPLDSLLATQRRWAAAGLHLVDVESYVVSGKRRWAGVFQPQSTPTQLVADLPTDDFQQKVNELGRNNQRLLHFESFYDPAVKQRLWSGIFGGGTDGFAFWRSLDQTAFQEKIRVLGEQGLQLVDQEVYSLNGQAYWSGAWRGVRLETRQLRDAGFCALQKNGQILAQSGFGLIDWNRN